MGPSAAPSRCPAHLMNLSKPTVALLAGLVAAAVGAAMGRRNATSDGAAATDTSLREPVVAEGRTTERPARPVAASEGPADADPRPSARLQQRLETCERFVDALQTELYGPELAWPREADGASVAEDQSRDRIRDAVERCGVADDAVELFCDEPPCLVAFFGGALGAPDDGGAGCMPAPAGASVSFFSRSMYVDCGAGPIGVTIRAQYDAATLSEAIGAASSSIEVRMRARADWIVRGELCDRLEE